MTEEAGRETADEGKDSPRMDIVLPLLAGGKRIADIGCNTGWFLDMVDCEEKIGIDCDETFREVVEAKGHVFIHRFSWNLFDIPDGIFDRVHFGQTIAHMRTDLGIKTIEEIYRILCMNGIFVISTIAGPYFTSGYLFAHDKTNLVVPLVSWFHHVEWEPPDLISILKEVGFEVKNFFMVNQVRPDAETYKRYRFVQIFVCKKKAKKDV